ncbi:ANTAR domain-containing protein [Actinocrinis sp.]|uniref:ANTAR domain-containing protein n=1 Tax=Actinocrinis sp. TaxID=1920516 RepID=UPI002D5B4AE3|nr:ANTAR domain-containing protein [Actinocrinis sp.]HZP51309.1 ANTAR domain-containing protein [Actinocrinis sp.]
MTPPPSVPRTVRVALGWAALERQRGRRAAAVAARHEERATAGPEVMREFHERLAQTHRRAEQRHYTAARMHESFAARLRAREPEVAQLLRVFMAAVAETADVAGAAVTLFGPESVETLAAASDERAKAVQDIEFALGEGPAHSSVELHSAVRARGAALLERWPVFGPAAADLGVTDVVAVPVQPAGTPLGALTVFDPSDPAVQDGFERLHVIADTLSRIMLSPRQSAEGRGGAAELPSLFAQADIHATVHQASGVLAAQLGCPLAEALSLIRAHAYAEGVSIDSVAQDIVDRRLRLDR